MYANCCLLFRSLNSQLKRSSWRQQQLISNCKWPSWLQVPAVPVPTVPVPVPAVPVLTTVDYTVITLLCFTTHTATHFQHPANTPPTHMLQGKLSWKLH